MRNTLITGMLLCLPAAVLLVSVSLALLAGRLRRAMNRPFSGQAAARTGQEGLHDDTTAALRSVPAGR